MKAHKVIRLVLGDQLNPDHSWFKVQNANAIYLMAEMRQETDYAVHHIQKVVGFFAAMRNFAKVLEQQGHQVVYLSLDHPENKHTITHNVKAQIQKHKAQSFEYQEPDEYRLDTELKTLCNTLELPCKCFSTEHFYTTRDTLTHFFSGKKQMIMESFYRMMRKEHSVLMQGAAPVGGKWNFDQENRKKWKSQPPIPPILACNNQVTKLLEMVQKSGVKTIGAINPKAFHWPVSTVQSQAVLDYFCANLLKNFGNYQDAMHTDEKFLFHSRISFALNTKMLSPKKVVDQVITAYYTQKGTEINLNQVEGFIRQILGWREYIRGIYWKEMPSYATKNELNNTRKLPAFYWTGATKMNCMKHSIKQSLETAYAHHIQRLMVTGNYALLTQTHPNEVDQWYLGIYIDAIEWVELPNTRGMSQFADGGILATKPYVSSGNYIQKMSNYCQGCHYNHKDKIGEKACPFNALYWNFLAEKEAHFKGNRRMGMMLSLLHKMDPALLADIKKRASHIIENPALY